MWRRFHGCTIIQRILTFFDEFWQPVQLLFRRTYFSVGPWTLPTQKTQEDPWLFWVFKHNAMALSLVGFEPQRTERILHDFWLAFRNKISIFKKIRNSNKNHGRIEWAFHFRFSRSLGLALNHPRDLQICMRRIRITRNSHGKELKDHALY